MITINAHKGKMIELKVTEENFHKDLDFIKKQLIGRKYNAETKMWEIPIIKANFNIMDDNRFYTILAFISEWFC